MGIIRRIPASIQIASWNAQSIRCKRVELEEFLTDHGIDVMFIQETFLKPSDKFVISNYNVYRNDRTNGPGGGTAIITKK